MRGYCPKCNRKYLGQKPVFGNCAVCYGTNDMLIIWRNWRNRKEEEKSFPVVPAPHMRVGVLKKYPPPLVHRTDAPEVKPTVEE